MLEFSTGPIIDSKVALGPPAHSVGHGPPSSWTPRKLELPLPLRDWTAHGVAGSSRKVETAEAAANRVRLEVYKCIQA